MNTLKTVYNKLFKEETQLISHQVKLESKKIELGIVEDVSKLNQESLKVITSVGNSILDIDKSYDTLTENTKRFQENKKKYDEIKKEFDFVTKTFNDSSNNLKNNIDNSNTKIENIKKGQTLIINMMSKAKTIKNNIEQTSKELGIDPKSIKYYFDLNQSIDNLDMILEDSSQALSSFERQLNSSKSLIK